MAIFGDVQYTANVYRESQGLYREIGVQGFQINGDCMYTRNLLTLISIVIFAGNLILQGYYRDSLH